MPTDTLKLTGRVDILINGEVIQQVHNLVVDSGKQWLLQSSKGIVDAPMTHLSIGTGTSPAAVDDTTLETEVSRAAVNIAGGDIINNTLAFTATFPANDPVVVAPATVAITEAGIFSDDTAGIMLAHTVFPAVNKGEFDSMTINWVITLG